MDVKRWFVLPIIFGPIAVRFWTKKRRLVYRTMRELHRNHDNLQPGPWWRQTVDIEVLRICCLAGWWRMFSFPNPNHREPPLEEITTTISRALGTSKYPNVTKKAGGLLRLVPQLHIDDPLTGQLCSLAWTGSCVAKHSVAIDVLDAVVRARTAYTNPDARRAASTIAEAMLPAVAQRSTLVDPPRTLAELERCVRLVGAFS
jgi:hypothetical protein